MFAFQVKQKISGEFRTTDGANTFARIRDFISTKHKQNLNILNANDIMPNCSLDVAHARRAFKIAHDVDWP
jgi:hypothetical protein